MPDDDPVGNVGGLDIGRKHLKPRPVVPKGEFDGFEVGAIFEPARIPGERLWTVIVGIEFIDRQRVVGRGRQPHHKHRAQQGRSRDDLPIAAPGARLPSRRNASENFGNSCPSGDRATNVQPADWCPSPGMEVSPSRPDWCSPRLAGAKGCVFPGGCSLRNEHIPVAQRDLASVPPPRGRSLAQPAC